MRLSPELYETLRRCDRWQTDSMGAFNPAAELLCQRWKAAALNQYPPTELELESDVKKVASQHWWLDPKSLSAVRTSDAPLTLNAMAKGTILDAACSQVMQRVANIESIMLNIGGDIRIVGQIPKRISIANPNRDAIGATPLQTLYLSEAAIATSGPSERKITIGSHEYSHIVNPSTGKPVTHVVSATVIASDAESADVLATICSVMPVTASLAMVDSLPGAKCLLVLANGSICCSPNWPGMESLSESTGLLEEQTVDETKKVELTGHEMFVDFEINKPTESSRYRRPYVAVWVEDKDGFPVKTLSLFLMTDGPGPRWHRDLKRWYTSDQLRLLVDPSKLIGTISKPTRNPGTYKIAWDGTDDHGRVLGVGKYTLYLEAAREHGTYQLLKFPFEFGGKAFSQKLDGNIEIKSANVTYNRK